MNHPHPDELLLFASGELVEPRMTDVLAHVGSCATCRDALARLDESLTALGGVWPRRSRLLARPEIWGGAALAAAAVLAVWFIRQPDDVRRAGDGWVPATAWSATAGYVAGGKAVMDIDAQLTRLEQEPYYARP
jgi:hypothetical protein